MASLLDPLNVKNLTLRNRIVMPPMHTGLASINGEVTNEMIEHYVERSVNLGLLIVEHSYISIDGKYSARQLGSHDDKLISGLEKLTTSVHEVNTPIVLQINHLGAKPSKDLIGIDPISPSAIGDIREIRIQEMDRIVENYALAADRAIKAGFDGIEIHGAHGYLLNQFYSPLTNRRKDKYGGSLDNRTKFPLEVVNRVREKIRDKLLLYRLGSVDLDKKGTQIDDSKQFAKRLEEAGVNILDVSGGICGHIPPEFQGRQGFFIPQAESIKKVIKIPVIGVGGIKESLFADMLIRNEKVDLVAIGRELIKDPDWSLKAIRSISN
ncbi:MAG: NADH:flavin oxidoreductase [Candidatus Bathyarchaeota archaeon]|nr:NADH:flavin oxidoreductase [Candidatus Bathyarchaeota archaeon]